MREPLTAWSVAISHSPSSALRSGLKLPPLRSDSITASTDGGSDDERLALDDGAGVAA